MAVMGKRRSPTKGPKTCRYCGQTFSKADHVERHERRHTKETPFQCNFCKKVFSRQDTLRRHAKSHPRVFSPSNFMPLSENLPLLRPIQARSRLEEDNILCYRSYTDGETRSPALDDAENNNSGVQTVNQTAERTLMGIQGLISLRSPAEESVCPCLLSNINNSVALDPVSADRGYTSMHAESHEETEDILDRTTPYPAADPQQESAQRNQTEGDMFNYVFDIEALDLLLSGTLSATIELPSSFQESDAAWDPSIQIVSQQVAMEVHKAWYTTLSSIQRSEILTRPSTPTDNNRGPISGVSDPTVPRLIVNEDYRERLHKRMQPRIRNSNEALPSANFLDNCLKLYFKNFDPVFPILHRPTFSPSLGNSYVLISMCSIGSMFVGSSEALKQGRTLYERLNRVILSSWERWVLSSIQVDNLAIAYSLAIAQAALLGQTFGYLSDDAEHLTTSEVFHGTVLTMGRRCKLLRKLTNISSGLLSLADGSVSVDSLWRDWAKAEETKRLIMGLYIHDAEFSMFFHNEPFLDPQISTLSLPCHPTVFKATSGAEWAECLREHPQPEQKVRDFFTQASPLDNSLETVTTEDWSIHQFAFSGNNFLQYVVLENINSILSRYRSNDLFELRNIESSRVISLLFRWYKLHKLSSSTLTATDDHLQLLVLWHNIFFSTLVNVNLIENAIGKAGPAEAIPAAHAFRSNLSPEICSRAILHAVHLQNVVSQMSLVETPPIHVPRCLFQSALVHSVLSKVIPLNSLLVGDWPELELLDLRPCDCEKILAADNMDRFNNARVCADILRRMPHWQISSRLAPILDIILSDEL